MKDSTSNLGYVVFLSLVAALGGILFGYDTAVCCHEVHFTVRCAVLVFL